MQIGAQNMKLKMKKITNINDQFIFQRIVIIENRIYKLIIQFIDTIIKMQKAYCYIYSSYSSPDAVRTLGDNFLTRESLGPFRSRELYQ